MSQKIVPFDEEHPDWGKYISNIAKKASQDAFKRAQSLGLKVLVMEGTKLVYLLPNGKKQAYRNGLQKNKIRN